MVEKLFTNGEEHIGETGKEGVANGKECADEKGKQGLANGKKHIDEKVKPLAVDKHSNAEFRPGDMTWIKLRGTSWWPAQIVDENAVSYDAKPRSSRKGKRGEILVRLYGTYTYSYMDPVTSLLEFNNVLKRNKCGKKEIFLKALEQDLSKLHSGRTNTGRANTNGSKTPSKRVAEEQDDDPCQTPEGHARRLKVMQDLGLTAPSGSPFVKNEQALSVVQ